MNTLPTQEDQPMPPAISVATRSDDEQVMALLTFAFSVDPLVRWVHPDLRHYLAHFPEGARIYGGKALDHSTAYCLADYQGWPSGCRRMCILMHARLDRANCA